MYLQICQALFLVGSIHMARPDFTQGEINVLDREGKQVEQNTGVIDFSGATLDEETGRMQKEWPMVFDLQVP